MTPRPVPSNIKGITNQSKLGLQLKYSEKFSYVGGVLRSERFFEMGVAGEKVQFLSREKWHEFSDASGIPILHELLESGKTNH
jgi:hypothetical protein